MFAKSVLVSIALVAVVPAFAAEVNPGTAMIAKLLGVDATQFTASELGQISAEEGDMNKQARARYILEERARGLNSAVAEDNTSSYFGPHATPRVGSDR